MFLVHILSNFVLVMNLKKNEQEDKSIVFYFYLINNIKKQ